MPESVSTERLRAAIAHLPSAPERVTREKWYRTQKQHWLGWLRDYRGSGYYGRQTLIRRDARFAYNHIVEVKMLSWLSQAAGVPSSTLTEARKAAP